MNTVSEQNEHHLKSIVNTLPDNPGIYQFIDNTGKIIYIGKAKSLKKRVSSYFQKDVGSGKVRVMLNKAADLKYIVVETEHDALLLENNLVKKYLPRYNVLLKDDKTFPWICIKNEPFPRIFSLRNLIRDGSKYYGPYSSVKLMKTLLDLIKQLYPLRSCNFNLNEENIRKKKYERCLEYHIGNCLGPCEGLQTLEEYNKNIEEIKQIIKGNIHVVEQELKKLMFKHADKYEFEKAQMIKEKIEILQKYQSKSIVSNVNIQNADVFSIITQENTAFVNYLKIIHGAVLQSHTVELKKKLDETPEELLMIAITDIRSRFESDSPEIIVSFHPGIEIPGVKYFVPQKGDKKELLDLSLRNLKYFILEHQRQKDLVDPERHSKRILNQAKQDLRLTEVPMHIECFDNSNIQGESAVAAMVVFKSGKPAKKDYRHFNIKTVVGPDDFASMEEIIFRRYKRLLEENQPMPQLIIVDGGKGQLSSALTSLDKLGLRNKIQIISIAKRLEEIYFPNDPVPMYLDKKSETLKLIQQLRDEAHRFGITHHRKKHVKQIIQTELTGIQGIGDLLAQKLLTHFKSVKNIRQATLEELQALIGDSKGKLVFDALNNQK